MQITRTVTILELVWTLIAAVGIRYGPLIGYDAWRDRRAREQAIRLKLIPDPGPDDPHAALAMTLIINSVMTTLAFVLFLSIGVIQLFRTSAPPSLTSHFNAAMLIASEVALLFALVYNHNVRRRVYARDRELEILRLAQVAALAAEHIDQNTEELRRNTAATEAVTHAMYNGPLAAQHALTAELKRNTAAQDTANLADSANTIARAASDAANTLSIDENTAATDRNTDAHGGDQSNER